MSSLEINKIIAAILTAGVIAMTSGFIAKLLIHPTHPEQHAYMVAVEEGEATTEEGGEPSLEPVLPMLASADPAEGEKIARKCTACHTFEEGGAHKIGPNLYNVVGAPHAHAEGFAYSEALQSMHDKPWTYQDLNAFLAAPKTYAPGTKMTFAGLKKVDDRADIIAYLRSLSGSPAPLPSAEEVEAAAGEAAPAGDGAAAESEAAEGEVAEGEVAEGEAAEGEASTTEVAEGGAGEAAAGGTEIGPLLAAATVEDGEKVARKCKACHGFEKEGPNKIGPNLYNVVGAQIAHRDDYKYSQALVDRSDQTWSYENLDAWLANPKGFAPGNKMTFAGLKKDEERAAMIRYMREASDSPPPLPQ